VIVAILKAIGGNGYGGGKGEQHITNTNNLCSTARSTILDSLTINNLCLHHFQQHFLCHDQQPLPTSNTTTVCSTMIVLKSQVRH
jgi:hypothetical protein